MAKHWWKIVSVILILYSIVAGIIMPLGPGIFKISPLIGSVGKDSIIHVSGYGTHFVKGKSSNQLWLYSKAFGGLHITADRLDVKEDGYLDAYFTFPDSIKVKDSVLVMDMLANNDIDGTVVLPNAFVFKFTPGNKIPKSANITVKTNKPDHKIFPYKGQLIETERNLFYHVPMWFAMIVLFMVSVVYSLKYLSKGNEIDDIRSSQFIYAGLLFAICGLLTGMLWAKFTWGEFWVFSDTKLMGAAVLCLEYFAYAILRSSIQDERSRARVSSVYNVFAAASIAPLLFILPRMQASLHPGNGGNPGFNSYDLDNQMRMVFYPAVLGWALFGTWIATIRVRIKKAENEILENE